jgi:hypothetical protein
MTPIPLAARNASDRLTTALLAAAGRGLRTPCSDVALRDFWISEHDTERKQAARWCVECECPVLEECLAAAVPHDERWCVFGGRDFSRRAGRKLQRDDAA